MGMRSISLNVVAGWFAAVAVALVGGVQGAGAQAANGTPHLEKQGTAMRLIVDGQAVSGDGRGS